MEVIVSLPITSTFLCVPAPTNCAPTVSAYAKPEQAAERSKPQAFFAPMRSCTRQAVAGKNMSGVTLASTIRSISAGSVLVCASTALAASVAMCEVAVPFSTTWRSRMPVRVTIHSSLVSTIFSRSALVITLGGTYPATPVIFAARRWDMTLLANYFPNEKNLILCDSAVGIQGTVRFSSEPQEVAQFDEKKPARGVVWRTQRLYGRGCTGVQGEVGEAVVITKIDGRARMQEIGQKNIRRKLLGRGERAVNGIRAAETPLHIEPVVSLPFGVDRIGLHPERIRVKKIRGENPETCPAGCPRRHPDRRPRAWASPASSWQT